MVGYKPIIRFSIGIKATEKVAKQTTYKIV